MTWPTTMQTQVQLTAGLPASPSGLGQVESPRLAHESGDHATEALLYVDLSLSSSITLLSRLAPLMAQLQREVMWSRLHFVNPRTQAFTTAVPFRFHVQLGYHIFNLDPDASHASLCLTGEDGHFCSFPPDEPASLSEQVTGRQVAEETLLQLCLVEYASTHPRRNEAPDPTTSLKPGTASPTADDAVLWEYLDLWSKECSGHSATAATDVTGSSVHPGSAQREPQGVYPSMKFPPFDKRCSLERLVELGLPVEPIIKECEQGDKAQALLQRQVDLHLSTVPLFFLNGRKCIGDVTPESIIRTLCGVGAAGHLARSPPTAPAATPWPICDSPAIARSPSLREANGDPAAALGEGDIAVAAHLLKTYGRSPGDVAASFAGEWNAPSAGAVDGEGEYRFKNVAASRGRSHLQPETVSQVEDGMVVTANVQSELSQERRGNVGRIHYEEPGAAAAGTAQQEREGGAALSGAMGPPSGIRETDDPSPKHTTPPVLESLSTSLMSNLSGSTVAPVDWSTVAVVLFVLLLLIRLLFRRRGPEEPAADPTLSGSGAEQGKTLKKND